MKTRSPEERAEAAWVFEHTELRGRPAHVQAMFDIPNSASLYNWRKAVEDGTLPDVPPARQQELRAQVRRRLGVDPTEGAPVANGDTPGSAIALTDQPAAGLDGRLELVHLPEVVDFTREVRELRDELAAAKVRLAQVNAEAAAADMNHQNEVADLERQLDDKRADIAAGRSQIEHLKQDVRILRDALLVIQLNPSE
jgi:hypothetical protein